MKIFGNRSLFPTVAFQGTESSAMSKKRSWFALATIVFTLSLIGTGLSGCRGPWVDAQAIIGNGGDLYIDIPKAKEHKHTVLYDISVAGIDGSGHASGTYWSSTKSGGASNDVTAFPLRYGDRISGFITEVPARKLVNGTYVIRGFVKFFDSDEFVRTGTPFDPAYVAGRFEYENGVVRNLTYQ